MPCPSTLTETNGALDVLVGRPGAPRSPDTHVFRWSEGLRRSSRV